MGVLVLLPMLTFGRVLSHGFVNWDDQSQLYQNPDFNPPAFAKIAQYWTRSHMDLYLPVTYTLWGGIASFARLDAPDASGATLDARYFHAANLLAHVASTLLVYAILLTLGFPKLPSALGSAVFAVHPLVVEPVAWASALYTVLSGTLVLASVCLYLRWARAQQSGSPRSSLLLLATFIFVVAMLTKPSAVVAPGIAFVLDWLILRRPLREIVKPLGVWILLAAPFALVVNRTQGAAFVPDTPLHLRPLVAADTVAFALGKFVAPVQLAVDYGRSPMWLLASPQRFWTWMAPAALLAIAWIVRKRAPWALASLLLVVAGMAPFLGLVKFDFQYDSTVADRYYYLSLLGVALAIAQIASQCPGRVVLPVGVGLVLPLAILSYRQAGMWKDSRTLFGATLAINPGSLVANNVLGYLDSREGNIDGAIDHYRAALRTWPTDAGANFNLGNALLSRGQLDEAIERYQVVIATSKTGVEANVYNNFAIALAKKGQLAEAEKQFIAALECDPSFAPAQAGLQRVRELQHSAAPPITQP